MSKIIVGYSIIVALLGVLLAVAWATGAFPSKRQAVEPSELDRRYSEQDRRAQELLGELGGGLTDVSERLGRLTDSLDIDVSDLRAVAEGIRAAAAETKEMENIITELCQYLSDFIGFYYDSFDASLRAEGFDIP